MYQPILSTILFILLLYCISAIISLKFRVSFISILLVASSTIALVAPWIMVISPFSINILLALMPFGVHVIELLFFIAYMLSYGSLGLIIITALVALSTTIGLYIIKHFGKYVLSKGRIVQATYALYLTLIWASIIYSYSHGIRNISPERWLIMSLTLKVLNMLFLGILPCFYALLPFYVIYMVTERGLRGFNYQSLRNIVLASSLTMFAVSIIILTNAKGKGAIIALPLALILLAGNLAFTLKFFKLLRERDEATSQASNRCNDLGLQLNKCTTLLASLVILLVVVPLFTLSLPLSSIQGNTYIVKVVEVNLDDLSSISNKIRIDKEYVFDDGLYTYRITIVRGINMSAELISNGTLIVYIEEANRTSKEYIAWREIEWIEYPRSCPNVFKGLMELGEKREVCVTDIRYVLREFGGASKVVKQDEVEVVFKSKSTYLLVFPTRNVKSAKYGVINTPIGWATCYPEIEGFTWRCGIRLPEYMLIMKINVKPSS